jgi:iron complex transport system substrate-binding protein
VIRILIQHVEKKQNFITILLMCAAFSALAFSQASAYERIVVLYPAVSPVLAELGASDRVVGTTRNDHLFKDVVKVGSHLRPNIELLNALNPDLVIAGSKRAFPDEMKERVKADIFYYNPATLDDILGKIRSIGSMLGRDQAAEQLITTLRDKLSAIRPLKREPAVIYEVMSEPLKVAGSRSIVTSIISTAGGRNLVDVHKKHVSVSVEKILELQPDFYLYQVGPMNRNPVPPGERSFFRSLKSRFIRLDELEFARPGINAFDAAVELNRIFQGVKDE